MAYLDIIKPSPVEWLFGDVQRMKEFNELSQASRIQKGVQDNIVGSARLHDRPLKMLLRDGLGKEPNVDFPVV